MLSRIATPAEACDALLHYAALFVSEENTVDAEKCREIAESIAIVKNAVSGHVVCATLNTAALTDEIAALEALGYSYTVCYVEMSEDVLDRIRTRVAAWPKTKADNRFIVRVKMRPELLTLVAKEALALEQFRIGTERFATSELPSEHPRLIDNGVV